jgi:hypothetical protein
MLEERRSDAQLTLDELFREHLLPFKLVAYEVEAIGPEEYIVRFHDSRLHSLDVSCSEGQCFREVFRAAVLARVARLSGPLRRKTA